MARLVAPSPKLGKGSSATSLMRTMVEVPVPRADAERHRRSTWPRLSQGGEKGCCDDGPPMRLVAMSLQFRTFAEPRAPTAEGIPI